MADCAHALCLPYDVCRFVVRTQAERDADRWRPGGVVNGNPVHVELDPDECVLVIREGVGVMCVRDHEIHGTGDLAYYAGAVAVSKPPPTDRSWIEMSQPRRRWWHRYTRRTV